MLFVMACIGVPAAARSVPAACAVDREFVTAPLACLLD
jgi:hypothetical protein